MQFHRPDKIQFTAMTDARISLLIIVCVIRKYSNAVQDDLWRALTQQAVSDSIDLPVDVATIMETWTLKMGFPLITVIRDYSSCVTNISQVNF